MVRLLNDYTRVCNTGQRGDQCSCDFRINIYECSHSEFYVTVAKILIPISALVTIMAGGFLFYLLRIKKIPYFLPSTKDRGWLRPRPMHSYHSITFTYLGFETIHLIALVNELYPSVTVAEFFNMMIIVPSSCAAVFYTVSIVYSTPNVKYNESYEFLNKSNGPNTRLVDIVGIVLFLQPIVTWLPLSIILGHFVEIDDIKTANTLYTVLYLTVVAWELGYVAAIAYFWYKLMYVIKSYIKLLKDRNLSSGSNDDNHQERIKKGIRNITLPVMAIICGLSFQAVVYAVMSLSHRTVTIYYFMWNVFYYWTGYVFFPLIGLFVESFLIYYTLTNSGKLPNSSSNASSSKPSSSSSRTQVESGITMENDKTKNTNINNILCCKPNKKFIDDTSGTSSSGNPPSPVIIHYTSETNTVVEIIKKIKDDEIKDDDEIKEEEKISE